MNLDFFTLNGYGLYVWPAFIISFVSCVFLYIKTKKELKKYERLLFGEYYETKTVKVKISKKALSGTSV